MEQKLEQPIGIFGGTFDPIHFGHLRTALEIIEQLRFKQIRFIPSYIPPHRENPTTSVELRVAMVKAAIESESQFVFDDREVSREGYSYMVDTLNSLRKDFPLNPIGLIIGMDAFAKIHTWHQWEKLLQYGHLIVMKRPDTDFDQINKWPEAVKNLYNRYQSEEILDLHRQLYGKILLQNVTQLAISSSNIRSKLRQNQSVRYLVPDSVLDLMNKHHLYLQENK